jgi:hypothetical protein
VWFGTALEPDGAPKSGAVLGTSEDHRIVQIRFDDRTQALVHRAYVDREV